MSFLTYDLFILSIAVQKAIYLFFVINTFPIRCGKIIFLEFYTQNRASYKTTQFMGEVTNVLFKFIINTTSVNN